MNSPISALSFVLVLLALLPGDAGAAAPTNPSTPPPHHEFPSWWVLLKEAPLLWNGPESGPSDRRLNVEALQRVEVRASAPGHERANQWYQVETPDQTGWLPDALLAPPPITVQADALGQIGQEPVDRYRGIAPEYVPADLVNVEFGYEPERTYRLRKQAARACEAMIRRAGREGLNLEVVSAYRSYATQRRIYLRKLRRSGWKQDTVAKPGHSEHQLGTTVDLAGPDETTLLRPSFGDTPEGRWLRKHAPEFGFALSYTEANTAKTGYAPEPWHYRYFGKEMALRRHAEALGQAGN